MLKKLSQYLVYRSISRSCIVLGNTVQTETLNYFKDDQRPKKLKLYPESRYGGESFVTLLTGSNLIGKQGAKYIKSLFNTTKVPVAFERISVGKENEYIRSILRNRVCLHVDLQHDPKEKAKSLKLNKDLDLFASIIKCHTIPGFNCRIPNVNITLALQNNTGDYTKLEYEPVKGVVETLSIYEDDYTRRYLKFVFDYAVKHEHKHITIGIKRMYLPLSDGRFYDLAEEMQMKYYPTIELREMDIEKLIYNLVISPQMFDMICSNDRYGTFIAAVCSTVCGGASLFSACELNDSHAIFKPLQTKLSMTDYRQLSPYGIVRTAIDLLHYLGNCECANAMEDELDCVMLSGEAKTVEFGGKDTGDYVICSIVNKLKCKFA